MSRVIYINSTLPSRTEMSQDRHVSSFHSWGYLPGKDDRFYSHKPSRLGIIIRSRLAGLDLYILWRVLVNVIQGYRTIYLVTQPDLLVAIPLLKFFFPTLRILSWVWTEEEAIKYCRSWKACDYIFCLTDCAFEQLKLLGLEDKSVVQILGADPDFYRLPEKFEQIYDISLLGLSNRDNKILADALSISTFSIATTERVASQISDKDLRKRLTVLSPQTNQDVIAINHYSKVTWIPLKLGDNYPTGYTTLVESLLCGTPVVIADVSVIPECILSLPGVFRYSTGSASSLVHQTNEALVYSQDRESRCLIRESAVSLLDDVSLINNVNAQMIR